jgi:hydroxyethylthiazole kinase-like uncharacterized protein yjeF
MLPAHTVEQVRAAEQVLLDALPEGALMQRAATGLAVTCARLLGRVYGSSVLLLVGSGDNGGDALHTGAQLAHRGVRVSAYLLSGKAHAAGLAAFRKAGGRLVSEVPAEVDLVVDGIVGIGGRGALRPEAAAAVASLPSEAWVVAVDVPSGVDAGTGEVEGAAVHADVTVTFGTLKPGLLVDPGAGHAGVVELVDMGLDLPPALVTGLTADGVAALLPSPERESDKYRRGVVGIAAGSDRYTGAAVLCVGGAVAGGAGMVRYVGPDHATGQVLARWPEVVAGAGRVQAWAVGSGGGEEAGERLRRAAEDDVPLVVDADALTAYADLRPGVPTLLTPHAGELARLLAVERVEVEGRRLHHATRAARELDAVVLLKGSTTVVADPSGQVWVSGAGTAALATAGTGDVLAGLAGALLAAGLPPFDAGAAAAYVHGVAARTATVNGATLSASRLVDALPGAFAEIRGHLGNLAGD